MGTIRKIGKYEVVESLGVGGFGEVYLARDPYLGRAVAIKLCTSPDEAFRQRFLREAKIAGSLEHESIVTVYEFGFAKPGPYLVQEYLSGEDLEGKIQHRDPELLGRRLDILSQVARGLEHAHAQGVLHRDIKPANIRILDDGRAKIMDFGIAKLIGAETQLTETGTVLGTAGYLAPEQVSGEVVDERTDVFAFGVLAYELTSFEHPFPGETISQVLRSVLEHRPAPVGEQVTACPPALAELIGRCLAKDPADRPQGFTVIAAELDALLGREMPTAVVPPPPEDGEERPVPSHTVVYEGTGPPPPPPVEGTLAPDKPPQPPPPPVAGSGGHRRLAAWPRWLKIGAVALPLILVAAIAVLWGLGRTSEAPETPEATAEVPAAPAPAPVPHGTLRIEAVPWGEVVRVVDADGEEVARIPEGLQAPGRLPLPAGRYTVEVSHPAAPEPVSCTVEVEASAEAACRVELTRVTAETYFKEVGWWR